MATTAAPPDETGFDSESAPPPNGEYAPGSADDSVEAYVSTAKRSWRLLVSVGVAVALITGIVTYLTPRKYRATATFVANEEASGALGKAGSSVAGIADMLGMGSTPALSALSGGTRSPDFYGALLTSKDVLDSIVNTQYHTRQFTGDLVKYLKMKRPTRAESEFAALLKVKKKLLEISVDSKTEMVGFTVETTDPELSAQIARHLLDEMNEFNLQRRQTTAGAERQFAEQRKSEALSDLEKAEQAMADFDSRNRSVNQSPLLMTERQGLERRIEIAEQVYMQLVQEYETSRIEEVRNTPVITVVDNPERLVEPIPRNTIVKMIVAGFVGSLLTLIYLINAGRRKQGRSGEAGRRRLQPADEWAEEPVVG
jgi:uncharacterized protein involved in exopolysaccharide biosynthesis